MTAFILLRNETLKTSRRLAFWVTLLAFSGISSLMLLDLHQRSVRLKDPRPFALPGAWWGILEDSPQVAMFFGSVVLVLLVASEFSWRTARQNVIDGLSKEQFFLGKLMLLPLIAAVMLLVPIIAGPGLAMIGEGLPRAGWITAAQVRLVGGAALGMLGMMSIAFLFATLIRSTGAALGVFILYVAFIERIGGLLLAWVRESWAPAARYFPTAVFQDVMEPARWGAPHPPLPAGAPVPIPTGTLLAFVIGYIVLLWLVSFLVFRRRDL